MDEESKFCGLDLRVYRQFVLKHEVDRMQYHISVPASTEQMGRLGIWYLQVRSRWIISSFQYSHVPSRWVVSVSGTRKYVADGSFWLLVHSSAEHHFADTPLTIIPWFRFFLAIIRVRVRVRVTSPGFATPGSMTCAVQVWSERWTVVKSAA